MPNWQACGCSVLAQYEQGFDYLLQRVKIPFSIFNSLVLHNSSASDRSFLQ